MNSLLEQIKEHTVQSISDLQLLSIFIGSSEAQSIMNTFDSFADLARKEWRLIKHHTLASEESAIKTEALFELSIRIAESEVPYRVQITSAHDANAYLGPKLRHLSKEAFYVVYLNNAKYITGSDKISHGGATATIVDPAEVMRKAILNEAQSIILAHNHPSGNTKESRADIQLTKRLVEAGRLLGVPVNDHIIIAGNQFVSLRAKGLIK